MDKTKKILITDGHTAYPEIIKNINLEQQKCTFHKIQNQRTPVWKKIHRLEKQKQTKANKQKSRKNQQKTRKNKKRCTSKQKKQDKKPSKKKKNYKEKTKN